MSSSNDFNATVKAFNDEAKRLLNGRQVLEIWREHLEKHRCARINCPTSNSYREIAESAIKKMRSVAL